MNIKQALQLARESFSSLSATPRLDAQVLLAHLLDVDQVYLLTHASVLLTVDQQTKFKTYLTRRINGEPIAYLVGEKEFWSLSLWVTKDTLIPRPETELLVELTLRKLHAYQASSVVILDMGTGSGAIALALAHEQPSWQLYGIDKSLAALQVAKTNSQRLSINNVNFLASDWFTEVPYKDCAAIVSNPPYIASGDPHLAKLNYEPQQALVAAEAGKADLLRLITDAPLYLANQGWLLLEHSPEQALWLQYQLTLQNCYGSIMTYDDLSGIPRVTVAQKQV